MAKQSKRPQHPKEQEPRVLTLVKLIGATATAGVTIVGLFFLFWPQWKPDVPKELRATPSNLKVEPDVTWGGYLHRPGKSHNIPNYIPTLDELKIVGNVIAFEAEIKGFKDRPCRVLWSMYDAEKKGRVPDPAMWDQEALAMTPEAPVDGASADVWVPLPDRRGTFFVRLEIYDDNKVRLTSADTEVFGGSP